MRSVALCSARGAPGVTTTALLVASHLDAVMVEADLSGGVVAVRYGLGREPGLVTLAAANPHEPGGWLDHAQNAGGIPVLVGPDAAETAESLWRTAGERIMGVLGRSNGTVVIDVGRIWRRPRILDAAEVALVLARPNAEELVAASHAVATLNATNLGHRGAKVGVVLVGDGTYRPTEIGESLGAPVLAHLPDDPTTAAHLRDGGTTSRSLARSRLSRAVAGLADLIDQPAAQVPDVVTVG